MGSKARAKAHGPGTRYKALTRPLWRARLSAEEREARDAEAEEEKEDRKFHWALWRLQRCVGVAP